MRRKRCALSQAGEKIVTSGIPVLTLGMGLGKPTLSGLAKFFHFLKQESVDILQTWLYHADLLGLLVGRMAGVKRVIWGSAGKSAPDMSK